MVWVLFTVARAHIAMDAPDTRGPDLKIGPCGAAVDARGTAVTVFQPGETITVAWHETVNHPSTYRISFDDDGTDAFADPDVPEDFYTNEAVLLDEIQDDPSGVFSVQVTLPVVECENCTLQLIQVMLDKPPYEPGTNDIYYQCADLALRGEPLDPPTGTDTDTDTAAGDTDTGAETTAGGGCGCATGNNGWSSPMGRGAPWLLVFALLALRNRRSSPWGERRS